MWHYADGDRAIGPVSDEEFDKLVRSGAIAGETLVWRQGMADWQPYGRLKAGEGEKVYCVECGRPFSVDDMIHYGHAYVCADCKNTFFQKIKEGVSLPATMTYAGFWIRAGAKIIDGIAIWLVQMLLSIPLVFLVTAGAASESHAVSIAATMVMWVIQIGIAVAYPTFFIGKYGATLGKMACQIKVVTGDGEKVTYLRALARAFAEWLSMLTLYIGYIIAAFDDEKRTLHDRICDTRVVYK